MAMPATSLRAQPTHEAHALRAAGDYRRGLIGSLALARRRSDRRGVLLNAVSPLLVLSVAMSRSATKLERAFPVRSLSPVELRPYRCTSSCLA